MLDKNSCRCLILYFVIAGQLDQSFCSNVPCNLGNVGSNSSKYSPSLITLESGNHLTLVLWNNTNSKGATQIEEISL